MHFHDDELSKALLFPLRVQSTPRNPPTPWHPDLNLTLFQDKFIDESSLENDGNLISFFDGKDETKEHYSHSSHLRIYLRVLFEGLPNQDFGGNMEFLFPRSLHHPSLPVVAWSLDRPILYQ